MASSSSSERSSGRLRCSFQDPSKHDGSTSCLWFQPNQGKRSSFILDLNTKDDITAPTFYSIPESPCHCYVDFVDGDADNQEDNLFFLGGFHLISTARSVEVYVTKMHSKQEELLMTCRGIPVRDNTSSGSVSDCFKVFSVVPGGPRPVHQLRLHLLPGLDKAPSNASTKLVSIQLTGRIPDRQQEQTQPQPTPRSQVTPSSAMMMQQMMMMASTPSSNMFAATPTPLASGSATRNRFYSPPPSLESEGRPPPIAATPFSMEHLARSTNTSFNSSFLSHERGSPANAAAASSGSTTENNLNTEAILAGVTFLVRSEAQAVVQILQSEIHTSQSAVDQKLRAMENKLQRQQLMMETMVQNQHVLMMTLQNYQQHVLHLMTTAAATTTMQRQQDDTLTIVVGDNQKESQSQSPSQQSFPTESSYDPTCRVPLSDRNVTANATDVPSRELLQESPNHKSADDRPKKQRDEPKEQSLIDPPAECSKTCSNDDNDVGSLEGEDEENETNVGDDVDALDIPTKRRDDDDDNSGGASGIDDDGGDGRAGGSVYDRAGQDNNPDVNATDNKEANAGASSQKHSNHDPSPNYDGDDDNSNGEATDSIVQKQFVFQAPPFQFPVNSGTSQCNENRRSSEGKEVYAVSGYPSIEKKASMVDHLSVRYCSTGVTEIMSTDTGTDVYAADSIEVLALFAVGSPKTISSSKSSSQSGGASHSPSIDGDGDIDDENPSDSSLSGYDSQDVDDLVSVSLFETDNIENVKPLKPLVPILKNGNGKVGRPKDLGRATSSYTRKLDY